MFCVLDQVSLVVDHNPFGALGCEMIMDALKANPAIINVVRRHTIQMRCRILPSSFDLFGPDLFGPVVGVLRVFSHQRPPHLILKSNTISI